jgi:inorganic triphosphatase YgiF
MTAGGRAKASGRRAVSLASGLDCATAFQTIAPDSVAGIRERHTGACAGDAEAVHQIRVDITRLRAAVAFFAPVAADADWRRLKKEISWLNASLGAARDSDVMTDYAHRKKYRNGLRAWSARKSINAGCGIVAG